MTTASYFLPVRAYGARSPAAGNLGTGSCYASRSMFRSPVREAGRICPTRSEESQASEVEAAADFRTRAPQPAAPGPTPAPSEPAASPHWRMTKRRFTLSSAKPTS